MGRGGTIAGDVGLVKWSYHTAAVLHQFSVSTEPAGQRVLRGRLVDPDAFKMSQAPLTFDVPTAVGLMRWPIQDWRLEGAVFVARLGEMET